MGLSHPNIYNLLETIKKEDLHVRDIIQQHGRGQPHRKRVRHETRQLGNRLGTLCREFANGQRRLPDFLRAVGHNIRFGVERRVL